MLTQSYSSLLRPPLAPNNSFQQNFSANNQVSATGYTYDPAGDLTADGNGNSYTYNADQMITASSGASYVYDALNQRAAKTGGSNAGETIYFNGVPIALHNPTSGAYIDLIYAGSSMIAEVAGTQTAVPTYRVSDHLGSLALQTNNSGTVTGTNIFLPFGQTLTETTSDQFQFIGLPQDTENSSYHAGYRNFSYEQGRWLSPDPYNGSYDITNPQSFNRYSYVMNNPMGFVDPSGLCDPSLLSSDCDILDDGGGGGDDGDGGGGGGYGDPGLGPCLTTQPCAVLVTDPDDVWSLLSLLPGGACNLLNCTFGIQLGMPMMIGGGGGVGGGTAPNNGQVPVHGVWTYGHFCGAGGMGTPINGTDAACQQHDACYAQAGLSPGSNFTGPNAQLQACNQQLCNAVRSERQSIINQAAARGTRNSRGVSPVYLPGQESEIEADNEINLYFTYVTAPGGSSCH